MATPSVARLVEAQPQYVRLSPGDSSYTIELAAEVLQRLARTIAVAEKSGVEIGGLLIGSWGIGPAPTVRVEEFEVMASRPEDGPVYLVSPQQQEQFAAARQRIAGGKNAVIGFFRSHLRSGPLNLSLADKGFLWKQFRSDNYLVLLVEAREPHKASLFVSADGRLQPHSFLPSILRAENPPEPSREAFPLPVKHPTVEIAPAAPMLSPPETKPGRRMSPELLTFCAVLLFAIGIVIWPAWETTFGGPWAIASSTDMALSIQRHGQNLKITWNRKMPEISKAEGATLTIVDGARRSEVQLGKDDLKFGAVSYVYEGKQVEADLALRMQDATSLVQSTLWQRP